MNLTAESESCFKWWSIFELPNLKSMRPIIPLRYSTYIRIDPCAAPTASRRCTGSNAKQRGSSGNPCRSICSEKKHWISVNNTKQMNNNRDTIDRQNWLESSVSRMSSGSTVADGCRTKLRRPSSADDNFFFVLTICIRKVSKSSSSACFVLVCWVVDVMTNWLRLYFVSINKS